MTAARGTPFTTTMGVVDRVHRDPAIVRLAAEPAIAAGLAKIGVHVVGVRHRTDRGETAAMNQALLARAQAHDDITLVATDDLRIGAGRTRDGAALADLHLDVVHDGADRDRLQRHGVARLD